MKDASCPFCNTENHTADYLLEESPHFRIIVDSHPITEGHILIIPKEHVSCVGAFSEDLFEEFLDLYTKSLNFIKTTYGSVSTFEHGNIGQSVFHSHMHLLPFAGSPSDIVSEGNSHLHKIDSITELRHQYETNGKYLFFSLGDTNFLVTTDIAFPRFFRDRFANALHHPERANWKEMRQNTELMSAAHEENMRVVDTWK